MIHSQPRPWLHAAILASAIALGRTAFPQEGPPQGEAPPTPAPPREAPKAETKTLEPPRGSRPGDVQKVFVMQHVDPGNLARLLSVFPAQISWVSRGGLSALAVSAKPAVLAAIEETIKRLDQPGAEPHARRGNVELTGYVLEGLAGVKEAEPLPSELEDVVAQLRRTFKYPAYRLLDTVVARTRDGSRFQAEGVSERGGLPLAQAFYELRGTADVRSDGSQRIVQLSRFEFMLRIPVPTGPGPGGEKATGFEYRKVGLSSDIDVQDGQYVVVGKSGLGDSENALVLVLKAKLGD